MLVSTRRPGNVNRGASTLLFARLSGGSALMPTINWCKDLHCHDSIDLKGQQALPA